LVPYTTSSLADCHGCYGPVSSNVGLRAVSAENTPKDHLPELVSSHPGPLHWAVPLTCTQGAGKHYFSMKCMSISALEGELKAFLHSRKGMLCPQIDYAK